MSRKDKERIKALEDGVVQAIADWFSALERVRPAGLDRLTDALLAAAPLRLGLPDGWPGDQAMAFARVWGQQQSAIRSRRSILADDADAHSRSDFWDYVSRWFQVL